MGKARGSMKQKRGKNKKKTWKQIQHGDVDKFMDDIREDERLGGIRSKRNEELFAIDDLDFTKAVEQFNDKVQPQIPAPEPNKSKRGGSGPLVAIEDLKCFQILKPHTAVKDPIVKRNRLSKRGERKTATMARKDAERQSRKKPEIMESIEICKDPWARQEPKTILDSEWINSSIRRQNLRPRASKPKQNVTSELPAIETPHPGFSYNPSFLDHQDLLKNAVTTATFINKKETRLNKAIAPTKCFTVEKSESEAEDEPIEGLQEDTKPHLAPESKAKTKQQKRKVRDEKEKVRLLRQKKQDNVRLSEVYRIKSIQKTINKTEKKQKERLAKAVAKKILREKFGQKKISKFQFEELPLDPALSEEMQGSLVNIPSHNRLVLERFNSLQKRNILEPRIKQRLQRKLRVKKFQKSIDKMEWEKTGYWNGIKVVK